MTRQEKLSLLKRFTVKKEKKVPLYKQLYFGLKMLLESEMLKNGSEFYSERELREAFGISQITVRKALELLENENLIERSQGNKTVVKSPSKFSWNIHDLTDDLYRYYDQLETVVLSANIVELNDNVRTHLKLKEEDLFCYQIERLRKFGEKHIAYSISYLFPSLKLNLQQIRETKNLSIRGLLAMHDEHVYYAKELVEARNATKLAAKYLKLPESFAVFFRTRVTYDTRDKPLEYVESFYNSKYVSYYTDKKILVDRKEIL